MKRLLIGGLIIVGIIAATNAKAQFCPYYGFCNSNGGGGGGSTNCILADVGNTLLADVGNCILVQ